VDADLPLTPEEKRASDWLERRAWETARDLVFMIGFDEARARVQEAADAFALEGDRNRVLFCITVVHIIGLLRREQAPNECRRSQTHEYLG
jgi:hypothetical protein